MFFNLCFFHWSYRGKAALHDGTEGHSLGAKRVFELCPAAGAPEVALPVSGSVWARLLRCQPRHGAAQGKEQLWCLRLPGREPGQFKVQHPSPLTVRALVLAPVSEH